MAKGLGITSVLNAESKAQVAGTHTVTYLPIDTIHDHKKNRRYNPKKIELLARDIEEAGLQTPIVVVVCEEGYIAVSGHRRLAAFRFLAATEGKEQYRTIPAIVRQGLTDEQVEEMLYDGNLFTEMPTDAELAAQLAWKKQRLASRKAAGEKIAGRLLELLAEELGISAENAHRYDVITRRAEPEVMAKFQAGEMSTREAFLAAKRPAEEQRELVKRKEAGEVLFPRETGGTRTPQSAEETSAQGVHVPPRSAEETPAQGVHVPPRSTEETPVEGVHVPPQSTKETPVQGVHVPPASSFGGGLSEDDRLFKAGADIRAALRHTQELMTWACDADISDTVKQHLFTAHAELVKFQLKAKLQNG